MIRQSSTLLQRIARQTSGVAMTEFALAFPFVLGVGLMGLEVANRVQVQMKVSQLASQIADNAARIGEQSALEDRKIYEGDINDLLYGADVQGGADLDLYGRGRVILSSLEVVPGTDDQQYIHWQRCVGALQHISSYGVEGDGENSDTFPGMGPSGEEVIAFEESAVMFVEIRYEYEPLIGAPLTFDDGDIHVIASFPVRESRDLTQIYQHNTSDPDPVADCANYGGVGAISD